jgi:hypothetical protein
MFLFMAGDLVSAKCDGPSELSGSWERWTNTFVLDHVEWHPSPVCNSSYLGSETVNGIQAYLVDERGRRHYASECTPAPVPSTKTNQVLFLNDYYDRPRNWMQTEAIRRYFKIDTKRRLGRYLYDYQRWLFDYLVAGHQLRRHTTESRFSQDVFKLPGYSNKTTDPVHMFNEYVREEYKRIRKEEKNYEIRSSGV